MQYHMQAWSFACAITSTFADVPPCRASLGDMMWKDNEGRRCSQGSSLLQVKTSYSDFETDVFANRRLVDYNFHQEDGALESIYIPAKDYSKFFIGQNYKGAEQPTFNQWTAQHWASSDSAWQRLQNGTGLLLDDGTLVLEHQRMAQQHDSSFSAALHDQGHSVKFFGMLVVAFLLIPALLWGTGAPFVVQVFAVYVSLYMAWSMLAYATRDVAYNSAILVFNALVFKLAVSLGLWRAFDGSSLPELSAAVWNARDTLCWYGLPAGLYAAGDVLRVVALRATSPGTFAVLFNSRVFFLVFAWQYCMGRRLKAIHWLSLATILLGCYAKEAHNLHFGGAPSPANSNRYYGYGAVMVLGVLTATAAVLNESLLQHRSEVGVNLQNVAMYGWGLMWTSVISVIWMLSEPNNTTSSFFHSDAWLAVWAHPLVLGQAVVLAVYGVATAYFLRYLNNIAREVALGVFALLSVAMDYSVFGAKLYRLEFVGVFLLTLGIGLFAWHPVLAREEAVGLRSGAKAVGKEYGSIQSEKSASEGSANGLEDLESRSSK